MLAETGDATMDKAVNVILNWNEDEVMRQRARIREKALHDEVSLLSDARAEGIAQGIEQGIAQGRAEAAAEIAALKAQIARLQLGKAD